MTESLLIVDDDASIREAFQRQLGKIGFAVAVASTAEEAMRTIATHRPAIVITDVRMPNVSGLELLEVLRQRCPDVDVVVMTAHEDMQMALAAMKGGASEFLVKPIDLMQIEEVIRRCLRERKDRARSVEHRDPPLSPSEHLVGRDPSMIEISKLIVLVAASRAPVLIRGETGVGKEVIARAIHANSAVAEEPFIAVNCTAVPEPLLESELFGHQRGAFTGAVSDRKGRFELAGKGTIFLDEIGDMSTVFQAKLLRVLQSGEFFPVGGERARLTTARVLAATHRPLERMIREGTFREDLYYRLRVVEIQVPALRRRRGDIRMIAEALLTRLANEIGRPTPALPDEVVRVLEAYDWPGNVRELENALSRALVVSRAGPLTMEQFALGTMDADTETTALGGDLSLGASERAYVLRVIAVARGNKSRAASLLRISRQRLDRILERHGLAGGIAPGIISDAEVDS